MGSRNCVTGATVGSVPMWASRATQCKTQGMNISFLTRYAILPSCLAALYACSTSETPGPGGSGGGSGSSMNTGSQSGSGGIVHSGGSSGDGSGGLSSSGGMASTTGDGDGDISGGAPTTGDGDGDGSGGTSPDDGKITYVYVGSGAFGGSDGHLSVYTFDRASRALVFVSEHPAGGLASSIVIDESAGRLYSGDEAQKGVNSFTIDKATGSLTSLGATTSANAPVHVSLSPNKDFLLAANYNEGNVDVYPIGQDGRAQASLGATATGTNAHCVLIDNQNHVLVANKGASTISHFDFSAGALTASTPASTALESPRHIVRKDNMAYVVSETADLISAFTVAANGALTPTWDEARLSGGNPGTDTGAEIQITPSGKYLYASNRGSSNTIVAYDISSGSPVYLEHEPTLGTTPRNFEMDPLGEVIIVANQDSGSLVVFDIAVDGKLDHASTLEVSYSPFIVTMARF